MGTLVVKRVASKRIIHRIRFFLPARSECVSTYISRVSLSLSVSLTTLSLSPDARAKKTNRSHSPDNNGAARHAGGRETSSEIAHTKTRNAHAHMRPPAPPPIETLQSAAGADPQILRDVRPFHRLQAQAGHRHPHPMGLSEPSRSSSHGLSARCDRMTERPLPAQSAMNALPAEAMAAFRDDWHLHRINTGGAAIRRRGELGGSLRTSQ